MLHYDALEEFVICVIEYIKVFIENDLTFERTAEQIFKVLSRLESMMFN